MVEIESKKPAILYFTSTDCTVCKVLKPKIRELINEKFPKMKLEFIDISKDPLISGQFGIFTVPVLLVFFEGRELIRKVRNISVSELEQELERPYRLFFD